MAFPNFFPSDDTPEVKPASNYFPTEAELDRTGVMSDAVIRETAERYAARSGKDYDAAYADVISKGPENIFFTDYSVPSINILDKAIQENLDYRKLVEETNKFNDNTKTVLDSKDSADIARDLTEEDMFQDPLWKQTVVMDRVRKGFANAYPNETMLGSAASFVGAITSEMTSGAILDFFNTIGFNVGREARGADAYKLLQEARSLEEVDKIVNDLVSYAKDYGYTGSGNPILMNQELISILSGGEAEYPVFNTAVNLLTGEAVWKSATAVGKAVMAKKAATAIDHVDMAAAVNGTDGGNRAATVAINTPETTARVSDHADYDINRMIKTSDDSAIDVTAKPADVYERTKDIGAGLQQKKSFIEDISARYVGDDIAAAEEIQKVVKEKLAQYSKITDTAIANVTADDIVKAVPKKIETVVKGATVKARKSIPEAAYNDSLYNKAIKFILDYPENKNFSVTEMSKSLGLTTREEAFSFINRMKTEKIISKAGAKLVNSFEEAVQLKKSREVPTEETTTKVITEEPIRFATGGESAYTVEEGLFNSRYVSALFVKSDGTLFKNREDAEKIVKNFGEGAVVETNNGFYIKYRSSVSIADSAPATKVGSGVRDFYYNQEALRNFTGSSWWDTVLFSGKHTTTKFLQSSYIMGAKKSAAILSQYSDILKRSFLKLPKEDRDGIDKVLTFLRDEDSFSRNTFYDETEFALKFSEMTKGRSVTPKIVEAYEDLVKFMQTVNRIEAERPLKEVQKQNGFHATFRDGKNLVIFRTEKTPNMVYDNDLGKAIKASEIRNRPVYEIFDESGFSTDSGYSKYIVGSIEKSRPVEAEDVYGFTPGGPRIIDDFNFIVAQKKIIKDISGEARLARPITALLAKTEEEAKKALQEIEILRQASINPAVTNEAFEELVKKYNGFDPSFVSASKTKTGKQAFTDWMASHGLSSDVPTEVVRRKMPLDSKSVEGDTSYEDAVFKNLNPAHGNRDRISYGYGNGSLFKNMTVLETLPRKWASANYYLGRRNYEKLAVEGFLKGAEEAGVIISGPTSRNRNLMDRLINTVIDTSTPAGRKFAVEQALIKERLAVDREASVQIYDALLNKAGNFMINLTVNDKVPSFIKNNKIIKAMTEYSTRDISSRDPIAFIRGLTFHPNFGVLNPDSMVMQASGVLNAMTRTNPIEATRAVSLYKALRGALINPTETAIKESFKRSLAANLVADEREFTELVTYLRNSGWLQIHDNIALGSPASVNISKYGNYWQTATNISALAFREGNIFNHLVSSSIAYREFRRVPKNANLDITKGVGKTEFERFMSYRIEDLSGSMSTASAARWQKGIPSLALQYMSQPIRLTEDMLIGRLNPGERLYFTGQQLALFGASGTLPTAIGYSMYSSATSDVNTTPVDRDIYTLARWGTLDYILSNTIGEYTAMTNRLAAPVAILDIFANVTEGKFTEVIGGPSGNIYKNWYDAGSNLFESGYNSLYILANTGKLETGLLADDFETTLRKTIRTADVGLRSYYLFMYNEYTRKNGDKFPNKYPSSTGIASLLGVPLQDVILSYDVMELNKKANEYTKKITREVERLHKASAEAETTEEFVNLRKQIEVLLLPLDPRDKKKIWSQLREDNSTQRMVEYNLRIMGDEAAKQLNAAIKNIEEME
jgi:hypothetical protein